MQNYDDSIDDTCCGHWHMSETVTEFPHQNALMAVLYWMMFVGAVSLATVAFLGAMVVGICFLFRFVIWCCC